MDDIDEITGIEDELEEEPIELLNREEFLEKCQDATDPIGDMKWVFQALGAADLIPSDAPSTGAWYLLQSLKRDNLMLKSFYTTFVTKLMPTKSDLEKEDARSNDRRERLGLIERLLLEPDDDAPVFSLDERKAAGIQDGSGKSAFSKMAT